MNDQLALHADNAFREWRVDVKTQVKPETQEFYNICDEQEREKGMCMAFPEKFRTLIELSEEQVPIPDYVWLSYAVCAVEEESCGWRGWIIESAWKRIGKDKQDAEVDADTAQGCPVCGKLVYRTGVEKQFQLNPDAESKIGYAYETAPITFKKSQSNPKSRSGVRQRRKE